MSNITRANVSYSLNQPLNLDAPYPIVAKRAPTTADKAPIGQEWVFTTSNAVYFLTSIVNNSANWTLVTTGGAGVFSSLTVNPGPTNLSTVGNGAVNIGNAANTAAVTITVGTGNFSVVGGGNTIGIGNDVAANTVTIGSTVGASSTTINAGTGAIFLQAAGAVGVATASGTAASPTATVVINKRVGQANYTGFTTAAAATQVFVITNSAILATNSPIIVTASNLGANDAQMTVTRVVPSVGSVSVSVKNNGAAALNGDVNINFWVLN